MQIADHFKQHPAQLITGAGMGMFSSKLAFRATALKIAGGYPQRFSFIGTDFKENHRHCAGSISPARRGAFDHQYAQLHIRAAVDEYGLGLGCFLVFTLVFREEL